MQFNANAFAWLNLKDFALHGPGKRQTKTLLRVMKLTAIFFLGIALTVSAKTVSQTITLKAENISLEKVFQEVKKQTGFLVLYSIDVIERESPVSVDAESEPLDKFLSRVFLNTGLTYEIEANTISIKKKIESERKPFKPLFDEAPPITGVIRNAEGNSLVGVNIAVKGTKRGTVTDALGQFSIEAKVNDVLIISSIGYNTREVRITSTDILLSIALEQNLSPLDEVQVVAYGTTTKRLNPGNIGTVKSEDIEKAPVGNPLLALQGRVPGLMITQANGIPGGPVKVRIQGENSMNNGNDPFYVIDGVPFLLSHYQGLYEALSGVTGENPSPLNIINPADIESIEVLKDAAATSIYGSRAANGAILITTKKGKAGRIKANINLQRGESKVARKMPVMNTQQYLAMRKEALQNDGIPIPAIPTPGYYDLTLFDQNRYTDWQKELIGNPAKYTDVQAGLTGGDANLYGSLSANYHRENSVFPGKFFDEKGGAHLSFSGSSISKKFKFQSTTSYQVENNKLPRIDLTRKAILLSPNAPALYDSNGQLNWAIYNGENTWINPLAYLMDRFKSKTNNLISNLNLSYEITSGLVLKSTVGYTKNQSNVNQLIAQASWGPTFPFNARSTSYDWGNNETWIIEPQISYLLNRKFGKLDFLLGSTFQQLKGSLMNTTGRGFTDDSQLENLSFATDISSSRNEFAYNYNALFGRINYNYENKYILEFSARKDGSSRFGPENLFHSFYSTSGAWIFSEEKWCREHLSFVSFGKIKMSYGTTGSDQIGDYKFMSLYQSSSYSLPYGGVVGFKPSGLSNPYLQWEETKKLNVGVDLGFLRDRILLNINYYRNRSSNQLLLRRLPDITGFPNINQNFDATVQNSGLEISINTVNIKTPDFEWSSSFNLSNNRNKLIEYEGIESSPDSKGLIIGLPFSIIKTVAFAGVDPQTGIYQFKKADGTLTASPVFPDDYYVIIDKTPRYSGGFANSFAYKGFTLDFLLQFVKQIGSDPAKFGFSLPGDDNNQPVSMLNNWKKPGDNSNIQKFSNDFSALMGYFNAFLYSDARYTDASYIRLKNLSASWTLPNQWLRKMYLQNAKIYFQGQNLLTFTSFKGMDPESPTVVFGLPPLRTWSIGLQIGL